MDSVSSPTNPPPFFALITFFILITDHHYQWEYKLVRSVSSINIRSQSLPNLDWSSSNEGKRTNKVLQYIAMCNMCILSANQPASSSSRSWSWSSKSSKPSSPSFSYSGQNYIESCTTKWPKDPQSCCCNAVLFSPKILFWFQSKVFNWTLSNAISWSFSKMFLLSRRIFATSWWLLRKRDLSEPDRWVEWQGHGYYILGRASRQRHMFQEYWCSKILIKLSFQDIE